MSDLAPDFAEPLFWLVGAEVLELPVEREPEKDGTAHVHDATHTHTHKTHWQTMGT